MEWSTKIYVIESNDKNFIDGLWEKLLNVRNTRSKYRWKTFSEVFCVDKAILAKQIKAAKYGPHFYIDNIKRNAEAVTFEVANWFGGTEHPLQIFKDWAKDNIYKIIYFSMWGEHGIHHPSYTNDTEGKYFTANIVKDDNDKSNTITINAFGESYIVRDDDLEQTEKFKTIEIPNPYNSIDWNIYDDDDNYYRKKVFFPMGKEEKYLHGKNKV